jgi:hypothetical protein
VLAELTDEEGALRPHTWEDSCTSLLQVHASLHPTTVMGQEEFSNGPMVVRKKEANYWAGWGGGRGGDGEIPVFCI